MSEQTGSWQPDPFGRNQYRYWDGAQWTDQVSNDGVVATDPAVAHAAPTDPSPAEPVAVTADTNKTPMIIAGVGLLALILGVGAYFAFFSGDDDDEVRVNVAGQPNDGDFEGDLGDIFGDLSGDGFMGGTELPPGMMSMVAGQIASESGLSQGQAECLVGQLFSQGGMESLFGGSDDFDYESMESTAEAIYSDCGIDPAQLEDSGSGFGSSGGTSYGDDTTLDAMWDACEGGDMGACDDLYFDSPTGSEYQRFADTCGGRQAGNTGNLCTIEFG